MLEEIYAHVREGYPHEVVGLLAGDRRRQEVVKAERLVNERTDSPHNRYRVDGRTALRVERALRQQGFEPVGYYHSHPDHPAQYSPYDLENAYLGMSYMILSVCAGDVIEIRSWRLAENRTEMELESIELEE